MSEEHDGFFGMIYLLIGEAGLIFDEERDAVFPGNVPGGDDGELVPGDFVAETDAKNFSSRCGGSNGRAVEHAGKGEIVDVARGPGDFFASFFSRYRFSDLRAGHAFYSVSTAMQSDFSCATNTHCTNHNRNLMLRIVAHPMQIRCRTHSI